MKKAVKKSTTPDITEFTDDEGKKWIQTSTDDLFSIKELNEILESIDSDAKSDEIILARIDFQNVNKEYYEKVSLLQKKLHKQGELLKKIVLEAKEKTDRKNRKLKELIEYIKKLHFVLAHYSGSEEDLKKLEIPSVMIDRPTVGDHEEKYEVEQDYETVEEIVLPLNGEIPPIR
jgi:hypothetical protein